MGIMVHVRKIFVIILFGSHNIFALVNVSSLIVTIEVVGEAATSLRFVRVRGFHVRVRRRMPNRVSVSVGVRARGVVVVVVRVVAVEVV